MTRRTRQIIDNAEFKGEMSAYYVGMALSADTDMDAEYYTDNAVRCAASAAHLAGLLPHAPR